MVALGNQLAQERGLGAPAIRRELRCRSGRNGQLALKRIELAHDLPPSCRSGAVVSNWNSETAGLTGNVATGVPVRNLLLIFYGGFAAGG
jgi:hypothetical protein